MGIPRARIEARRVAGRVTRLPRVTAEVAWLYPSARRVQPYTMLPTSTLLRLGRMVRRVLAAGVSGAFVECGVWRGGASFLMADILRREGVTDRVVWMFDSFEGMPKPDQIDGKRALEWYERGDPALNDWSASLEEVQAARERVGLAPFTTLVKGWFEETLPATKEEIGQIALLRLDSDWYASVSTCLEALYDQVAPGGYVLIDDYYAYEGCARAIHAFLGDRQLGHRIVTDEWTAYFRKDT